MNCHVCREELGPRESTVKCEECGVRVHASCAIQILCNPSEDPFDEIDGLFCFCCLPGIARQLLTDKGVDDGMVDRRQLKPTRWERRVVE